jgi:hypothetical protein
MTEAARERLADAIYELVAAGTETLADDIHGACLAAGMRIARESGGAPVLRAQAGARALVARDARSRRIESFALFVMEPDTQEAVGASAAQDPAPSDDRRAQPELDRQPDVESDEDNDSGLSGETRRMWDFIIRDEHRYESFLEVALEWPEEWTVEDLGRELARHALKLQRESAPGSAESEAWAAIGSLREVQWAWMPFPVLHAYAEVSNDTELLDRLQREHARASRAE